jgi:hypothetical protein
MLFIVCETTARPGEVFSLAAIMRARMNGNTLHSTPNRKNLAIVTNNK